jgi:hypothetical protein
MLCSFVSEHEQSRILVIFVVFGIFSVTREVRDSSELFVLILSGTFSEEFPLGEDRGAEFGYVKMSKISL